MEFKNGKISLTITNKILNSSRVYNSSMLINNLRSALEVIEQKVAMIDVADLKITTERTDTGDVKFNITVNAMRLIPNVDDYYEDDDECDEE